MKPRHESQLAFWGFTRDSNDACFAISDRNVFATAQKLAGYLTRAGLAFTVDASLGLLLEEHKHSRAALDESLSRCRSLKDGAFDFQRASDFTAFLNTSISRQLKEHQYKAALHLLTAENAANFSVPGSGKTAVVISVFEKLRREGKIDALFVVGPPACFTPWKAEFQEVLGIAPLAEILAGGDIDTRRSRYLVDCDSVPDLFLTTFQTLQRDWEYVQELFLQRGIRFFLVIDEAHYIKQIGGTWAAAVLNVAKYATRRCVLTGTPFPRSYVDAFNLFDILWPEPSPISFSDRHRISLHVQRSQFTAAADILQQTIGPLFYRVRKEDLGLAEQVFHEPIRVQMNDRERCVYDSIFQRVTIESQEDFFRDFDLLVRLRRGRMMRLRQCVSYAALLSAAVPEYDENLLVDEQSLATTLREYDEYETPAKLEALLQLVHNLRERGHKIVVWSNFVRTLELIVARLSEAGYRVGLIYGRTPFEQSSVEEELTREQIIRDFSRQFGGIDVLVANPAACAESVSLHKSCSHAIYYDLSYNCAQYLQSLDRIHRVGGSEVTPAHYYFLQCDDSIDSDILMNVRAKARSMSAVIDHEYAIYSLDMFGDDGDLEAYGRIF
jgi:SNF2 family DNA or RNA helicase